MESRALAYLDDIVRELKRMNDLTELAALDARLSEEGLPPGPRRMLEARRDRLARRLGWAA